MVRVNKKKLARGLEAAAWRRLHEAVRASASEVALRANLAKFLTPAELTLLEKRLAIPVLLAGGKSYREICRALDVSANTVSFVKHRLGGRSAQ